MNKLIKYLKMDKFLILLNIISFIISSIQIWTPEVSGYSKNGGYAGIFGIPISSIRISGNQEYSIRLLRGTWLQPVTGNNIHDIFNGFSGIEGREIDGVAIKGTKYRVHILGGDWLEEVSDYDTKNPNCGIIGKPIDAIMVKGRIYSTAYTLSITNTINYGKNEVSQNTIVNCAKNQIGKHYVGDPESKHFNSSDLAYYCHEEKIPIDVNEQFKGGIYIVNPQPGDLLFFNSEEDNDKILLHSSICIGNGWMIHSPNSTEMVQYTNYLEGEYWTSLYKGARRYWS